MRPRIAAAAVAFLAGCSILPPAEYPQHEDHYLEVLYELPARGERRLQVPFSGADLTVYELSTEPAGMPEAFADGRRWLLPPQDADTVKLRVRYRVFPATDDAAHDPHHLFPGAAWIRPLQ